MKRKNTFKITRIKLLLALLATALIAGATTFYFMITTENNNEVEEALKDKIIIYVNEISNNYFSLGRLPIFDNINDADKAWIYGHLEDKNNNGLTKADIESHLKNFFGENLEIDLGKDKEALEANNIHFNKETDKYEILPAGRDITIQYVIDSIKYINEEYIVNVIEYAETSDFNLEYSKSDAAAKLIMAWKDYDKEKSLMENGEVVFVIEPTENKSIEEINTEVLNKKDKFLSYNIILEKDDNECITLKRIEKAK